MSLGEIIKIAAVDTALGMGTVFGILIFISICIWLLGIACREKKPAAAVVNEAAASVKDTQAADDPEAIDPEIIAVITAAIHQHIMDENGESDGYVVRKVRRATWKHTS